MIPAAVRLQPAHRFRLLPPGVTGLHLPALFEEAGLRMDGPDGESRTAMLVRLARPLLDVPERLILAWRFLNDIRCVWMDGGGASGVVTAAVSASLGFPAFNGDGGPFLAEEGGLAMLEELDCPRGMVCDLGQTLFKVSWAGERWGFPRDLALLPICGGTAAHSIAEKGSQRRALRRFIADSLRTVMDEVDAGTPEGVVFALPSAMDKWGQPAGSSYIGMKMDTQLVTHALEMAGLPDIPHWLLNDAELAATSALFDERVIQCGGKALVFTLGTAVGCALADPLAAALYFAEQMARNVAA